MKNGKSDYPFRASIGFTADQHKLLETLSRIKGNSISFLIRRLVENGAKREIDEAKKEFGKT